MHQSPCLGAGLLWRSLGRSLLANAMRVRLCLRLCGYRRPAAKPRASSQQVFTAKDKYVKERVRPLAATTLKNLADAAMQSLLCSAF